MKFFAAFIFCLIFTVNCFGYDHAYDNSTCRVSLKQQQNILTKVPKTTASVRYGATNLELPLDPSSSKDQTLIAHQTDLRFFEDGEMMFSLRSGYMVTMDISSTVSVDVTLYKISCSGPQCAAPVIYWEQEEITDCYFDGMKMTSISTHFFK